MENKQTTSNILMVRPASFGFNPETAETNVFQQTPKTKKATEISQKAIQEFDNMVDTLRKHHINVLVAEDSPKPMKPDAVFPNNWISMHHNGQIVLYPMLSQNRRVERRKEILELIEKNFTVTEYLHYEQNEANNRILEGTGSIVFDHPNKVAYACTSQRTDATLLVKLCKEIGYQPASFRATDSNNFEIYHTNIMMSIGESFVVVCMDAVEDGADKLLLTQFLRTTGKDIITISREQMNHFAGNILQVATTDDKQYILLSETARKALDDRQLTQLQSHAPILSFSIPTIEEIGDGSVRCMLAEIFLPKK